MTKKTHTDTQSSPHSIASALQWAVTTLSDVTDVPELEAEILLTHALQTNRSHLRAWPEKSLTELEQKHFFQQVNRRIQGEPIAYITGKQEFWSLELTVTPDTLIPRPETELLVELALKYLPRDRPVVIADLGTGSGAIALALAKERQDSIVYATDVMAAALAVAKTNANELNLKNIYFQQGDWCKALPGFLFDAIISNPPYIAENDPELCEKVRQSEPLSALIAPENGLQALSLIIQDAKKSLKSNGYILLEHGHRQAAAVKQLLQENGYTKIETYPDLAGLDRVTIGQFQRVKIAS